MRLHFACLGMLYVGFFSAVLADHPDWSGAGLPDYLLVLTGLATAPLKSLIRPLKGLIRPLKRLIRPFKGLIGA